MQTLQKQVFLFLLSSYQLQTNNKNHLYKKMSLFRLSGYVPLTLQIEEMSSISQM